MAEYTLKFINHRAKFDAESFIMECETHYRQQVSAAADEIAKTCKDKPIVLLNGPSSSGKTTTASRLAGALSRRGIQAEMISMDDYYRTVGSYEVPRDTENDVDDWESPECMHLPLLSEHLAALAAGEEISIPRFDFASHTFIPDTRTLRLQPDQVVVIEGIHAFNPVIMGDLAHMATGVYLSVASTVQPLAGGRLEPSALRFLRRAMRDSLFRGSPVCDTVRQWKSVRRGERLYIKPYRGQANLSVDTFLPYEFCILAQRLAGELGAQREALQRAGLPALDRMLKTVEPIAYEPFIPADSLLHEFIG